MSDTPRPSKHEPDFSPRGRARVYLLTCLGTLFCICVAFVFDSYSFETGWRWGDDPMNNVLIPLVLAPPLFYVLLSKLRELALAHQELLEISATDSLTSCYFAAPSRHWWKVICRSWKEPTGEVPCW